VVRAYNKKEVDTLIEDERLWGATPVVSKRQAY